MKTIINLLFIFFLASMFTASAQVDIQPDAIAINDCDPLSEIAVNGKGSIENTVHISADANMNGSTGLRVIAKDITNGLHSYGIVAQADFAPAGTWSHGIVGSAVRTSPSNSGRAIGVRGQAGQATPGANYGVFGDLAGTNEGTAILGYDRSVNPTWSQVLPSNVSYAGYFFGKGYFHNNLGLGEDDPKERLHVNNGNIYIQGVGNSIIFETSPGSCHKLLVGSNGSLIASSVPCP